MLGGIVTAVRLGQVEEDAERMVHLSCLQIFTRLIGPVSPSATLSVDVMASTAQQGILCVCLHVCV